jgi:hypothetical protein
MTTFAIASKPTFTASVTVVIPGDADDGKPETHTFVARYMRMSKEAFKALLQRQVTQEDAMRELLVGWSGLPDNDGNEVPFSAENLESLLAIPQMPLALSRAFYLNNSGAELKN